MPDRLLTVDDDPEMASLIAAVAARCGYDVRICTRVADCLEHYRAFGPSLITMDLAMPGADGIELLRILAGAGCTAPIVIISGLGPDMTGAAERLGAAWGLKMMPGLQKPVRAADLIQVFTGHSSEPT